LRLSALALALLLVSLAAAAQEGYRLPPQPLVDIIDAAPTPSIRLSPDREWMALIEWASLPPISELAQRELRLAGLRIRPQVDGPSRTFPAKGLSLLRVSDRTPRAVTGLPAEPRIDNVAWSPDGRYLSFIHTVADGNELWVVDAASGAARKLTGGVSLTASEAPKWLPDSRTLVTSLVPAGRGAEPAAPSVPTGPVVQENLGRVSPARTYQDLLQSPHDETLFEYYLHSQLVRVDVDGHVQRLGEPGLLWSFDPSPDGRYLLVRTLHRPFSYLVPATRFPVRAEILDAATGAVVHLIADLPLRDEISMAFDSVADGPRGFGWRDDVPATAVWQEALDGGDAGREAELRDRVLMLPAPFTGEPAVLATLGLRFADVTWGDDDLAMVTDFWWKTRQVRTWIVQPGNPSAAPRLLFDRSFEDRYSDPGNPVTRPNAAGRDVLLMADGGAALFMIGDGASPEGDRPFLDKLTLASGETERLFLSQAPYYERPIDLLDDAGHRLLTRRESVEEPPNYFVRDLSADAGAGGTLTAVTEFPHPTPQLAGIQKEQIRYQRADGVQLTGTLYLPAGYSAERDGPLPTVMWAYPQEFKSADAAGQVTSSPYRFDRVGWWSPLLWLTRGYAVLDDPTLPIIGEGDVEPNDTYVEQLVAGAQAAVDEVVRRGVTDRQRIAIGGHSYGAFMTANLLAHSDLFAAGIARSGAYNRTLTPFGFQAEERTVWQAPEVYAAMSPFMHADKVNEPLLMIHGEADNNSGTFPMQSERFYSALKGLGGTARLVMLPYESHGYRARESIMHMLWESSEWLDHYVKNKPADDAVNPAAGAP
jgi:dipeptidyl aminopeptidase/acylaminoacyl peptidase